jgi:hypothetical protein
LLGERGILATVTFTVRPGWSGASVTPSREMNNPAMIFRMPV